jgi:DNA helicase IV
MKDTNQVQKALETKAKKELQKVVDEFVASLHKLNKTYRQPTNYNLKESRSTEAKEFFYVREHSLETILHDMLIDAYLKPMVHKKTQELLNKLELI